MFLVQEELPTINAVFEILQWSDLDAPEVAEIPMKYEGNLSDFQRLLLLRCFRVDRVYLAISHFVTKKMGEKYVTPPVLSFEGFVFLLLLLHPPC